MKSIRLILTLVLAASLAAGCTFSVTRTGQGTFQVESSLTEAQIQAAIRNSLSDPSLQSLTASLQDGYILVSGQHKRTDRTGTDSLTFRLDLGVGDGHLTALVSNVVVDNFTVSQELVNTWNQRLADGLVRASQKTAHSTLQSVSVTPQAVTFVWIVTK